MILGAGDEVPAKRSRFGVKNHGLKAAFTIGDEIRLMSSGQTIVQTLYAKGRNMPPHPGASEHPMEDPQAPTKGCRVIVQYRDADLEPTQGEAIKLDAVDVDEIETLFESACASLPEQFAGIVSPGDHAPIRNRIAALEAWRSAVSFLMHSAAQSRQAD